jgi:hypothetical protein
LRAGGLDTELRRLLQLARRHDVPRPRRDRQRLRLRRELPAAEARLAFSYARPGRWFTIESPIAAAAAAVGEPWKTRFTPARVRVALARARLRAASNSSALAKPTNRYRPMRSGLPPFQRVSIGAARVTA